MNRQTALRLTLVTILLATAYALALWHPVRTLKHGVMKHGVIPSMGPSLILT